MRILQLCNKFPYPPNDGGGIAMFNLTVAFSENNNDVTILAMNTSKHFTDPANIPAKYRLSIDFRFFPVNTRIHPAKLLFNLFFSSKPYNAVRFIDKNFGLCLQKLLTEKHFDIIQLESLYLTPYIKQIRKYSKAAISYRAHNVEYEIWKRTAKNISNPFKKLYFKIIANRLEQFEKQMINKYDLLVPITTRDANKLTEMGNSKPLITIPTGILEENFLNSSSPENINSLFYIGALDWIPNQEGLVWFIKNVWNDIRVDKPKLTFHIAGRHAPDWFVKICTENKVNYHGEVESAHEFYRDLHIMVVPLFAGSGMRIKIIEAMARSKVVITTSIGAEGLGLKNNEHAIIANQASDIKIGITTLLENKRFFTKLEKNSFEFTRKYFRNEKISKKLLHFYEQHLTK